MGAVPSHFSCRRFGTHCSDTAKDQKGLVIGSQSRKVCSVRAMELKRQLVGVIRASDLAQPVLMVNERLMSLMTVFLPLASFAILPKHCCQRLWNVVSPVLRGCKSGRSSTLGKWWWTVHASSSDVRHLRGVQSLKN